MSRWNVSGAAIPSGLPYAAQINGACRVFDFPPCFAYAIAANETIGGEVSGSWKAATIVSSDGGHGLFQLTSWVPDDWADPSRNAYWAVKDWLLPDAQAAFRQLNVRGDDLVRAVAAAFNGGWAGMLAGHRRGDVDSYTTNHYAQRALDKYHRLVNGHSPF